jgi:hypothetical protein
MTTPGRYIPTDSIPRFAPIAYQPLDAVVYAYTDRAGHPCAIAYAGKSAKRVWHYIFGDESCRSAKIDRFFEALHQRQITKAAHATERKTQRAEFRHGYTPGDILWTSWGYDMTNVDFYQVISTTEKTVTIRELQAAEVSDGYLTGTTTPIPGKFASDSGPATRTVQPPYPGEQAHKGYVPLARRKGGTIHRLDAWDGRPKRFNYCD